jgi:hypothetical protein
MAFTTKDTEGTEKDWSPFVQRLASLKVTCVSIFCPPR